jgi:TPR repeat protein
MTSATTPPLMTSHNTAGQDYQEAVRWYQMAAAQQHTGAMTSLGTAFNLGWGVAQDHTKAALWYTKAAEQGSTVSMYVLLQPVQRCVWQSSWIDSIHVRAPSVRSAMCMAEFMHLLGLVQKNLLLGSVL